MTPWTKAQQFRSIKHLDSLTQLDSLNQLEYPIDFIGLDDLSRNATNFRLYLFIISLLMINLYKQTELRQKNKSLYPINKSHTASMNLRVSTDLPAETIPRDYLKNSYRQPDD